MKSAKLSYIVFQANNLALILKRAIGVMTFILSGFAVLFGSLALCATLFQTAWGLIPWVAVTTGWIFAAPHFLEFIDDNTDLRDTRLKYYL